MTHYPETCPSYSAPDPGGHDAWSDWEPCQCEVCGVDISDDEEGVCANCEDDLSYRVTNYTDEELSEAIYALGESYYESLAQHRSEMAAYGDSWPGAQVQLNRARRQLVALEAEYERRQQLLRKLPTIPSYDNDNEPF